jgi:hypothetical protein
MRSSKKSKWEKPELTVLTRNKPEEAVLMGCKDSGVAPGPDSEDMYCAPIGDCPGWCDGYSAS